MTRITRGTVYSALGVAMDDEHVWWTLHTIAIAVGIVAGALIVRWATNIADEIWRRLFPGLYADEWPPARDDEEEDDE